jgi:hypothetical protein
MEIFGILPSVYLSNEYITDKFDRKRQILKNYNDTTIIFHIPKGMLMESKVEYGPKIIVPSLHLALSNDPLDFYLIESSDYIEMWKDYPKK